MFPLHSNKPVIKNNKTNCLTIVLTRYHSSVIHLSVILACLKLMRMFNCQLASIPNSSEHRSNNFAGQWCTVLFIISNHFAMPCTTVCKFHRCFKISKTDASILFHSKNIFLAFYCTQWKWNTYRTGIFFVR